MSDLQIEFYETTEDLGDSNLMKMLDTLSKIQQSRKVIGIFDRDVEKIINSVENNNQKFKNFGNNVYAFCIPKPSDRAEYLNISIEFYYKDCEIIKEHNNKRLCFSNEVYFEQSASNKNDRLICRRETPKDIEELSKKIFDENAGTIDWMHSKSVFAELISSDELFSQEFSFDNFKLIFDKIEEIIGF